MAKYFYISIGGAAGALLRHFIEGVPLWGNGGIFPFNTLLINVTGSFLLAVFLTIAFEVMALNPDIRLGISTGFLGAFTTFSALCKESVMLMESGRPFLSMMYMASSLLLGFTAAYLGILLARRLAYKSLTSPQKDRLDYGNKEGSH